METKKLTSKSQTEHLLAYLKENKHISTGEARLVFGIERLSARIYDLRKRGHVIRANTMRDKIGSRYTRYTYVCRMFA